MKIKAIPIKSRTLCDKCVYDNCDDIYRTCDLCSVLTENNRCACVITENGKPCRHFKRKESTMPKITSHGFFVDKCKCGGNISVVFGFSCTGKPQSTLECDKCHKAVIKIGNLKQGTCFMDIWEGADNGK